MNSAKAYESEEEAPAGVLNYWQYCHRLNTGFTSAQIISVLWHEGERDPEARWIPQKRTSRKTRRRWGP